MALDPQVRDLLDMIAAAGAPPLSEQTPEEARASFAGLAAMGGPAGEPVPTGDRSVPGPVGDIPVRLYRPSSDGPLPEWSSTPRRWLRHRRHRHARHHLPPAGRRGAGTRRERGLPPCTGAPVPGRRGGLRCRHSLGLRSRSSSEPIRPAWQWPATARRKPGNRRVRATHATVAGHRSHSNSSSIPAST